MKILQVPTYIVYGGMSLHVLSLSRGLRNLGHQVEVLSMCDGPLATEFRREGIPIDVIDFLATKTRKEPLIINRSIRYIRDYINESRPDIVHTHGPRAHFLAGRALPGAGRPVSVASMHGSYRQFTVGDDGELGGLKSWIKKLQYGGIDRLTARNFDMTVAVCRATRDEMVNALRIPPEKVRVIHNGIEEQRVDASRREELRREFGFNDSHVVVVCVGRIAFHKGLRVLLDAMEQTAALEPAARFLFVGEGPMENELKLRVENGSLKGKAVFAGSRKDAVAIIAASELLVMPSLSEGLPITLLESASVGRPMVATDVGGMPEVVMAEETGLLVPPRDSAGLAGAMVRLIGDKPLRDRMGAAARELWEKEFTAELMVGRFESLYRELLEAKGGEASRKD